MSCILCILLLLLQRSDVDPKVCPENRVCPRESSDPAVCPTPWFAIRHHDCVLSFQFIACASGAAGNFIQKQIAKTL